MKRMSGLEALSDNVRRLVADSGVSETEYARRVNVSAKTINNIINAIERDRDVKTSIADEIARALRIDTWKLYVPHINLELLKSNDIETMVDAYIHADQNAKKHLLWVAEQQITYNKILGK